MDKLRHFITMWKLKRIVKTLESQLMYGQNKKVINFIQALDATCIMAKQAKAGEEVFVAITRGELEAFVRYMTDIHVKKASQLRTAYIGFCSLFLSAKATVGEDPKTLLEQLAKEHMEAQDRAAFHASVTSRR